MASHDVDFTVNYSEVGFISHLGAKNPDYYSLLPHLPQSRIETIERQKYGREEMLIPRLVSEIARLEKEWKIV